MKKNVFAKIALIAAAGFAVNAFAATASDTFQVKIKITSSCSVAAGDGMGVYTHCLYCGGDGSEMDLSEEVVKCLKEVS